MRCTLYKFDGIKLEYKKVILNYKKILIFSLTQIIVSVLLIFIISFLFDTPKEVQLKKELNDLNYQLYMIDKKSDGIYYLLQTLEEKDSIINYSFSNNNDTLTIITPQTVNDKLDNIGSIIEYNGAKFKNIIQEITSNNTKLRHYPAIKPIATKDVERISSGYSMRIHPIYKINKFHYGMDFVAKERTPVYATADGVVTFAGNYLGFGNFIKIDHGYNYETAYGHLNSIGVRNGQKIVRGQIIGTVGNTGISTGDHLHYEVIYMNKPINPINFFSQDINAEEYELMLKITNTLRVGLD